MDALALYRESTECTLEAMRRLPSGVFDVAASALDNASDTLIDQGRRDEPYVSEYGCVPTDALLACFIASIETILACDSTIGAETREWFESRGVRY